MVAAVSMDKIEGGRGAENIGSVFMIAEEGSWDVQRWERLVMVG